MLRALLTAGCSAALSILATLAFPAGAHARPVEQLKAPEGKVLRTSLLPAPPSGPPMAVAVAPNPVDRLELEGGGLDLSVGFYGDCTRVTEVGHDGAYVDGCIPRSLAYFIGHNPGPFTALASVAVGQVVDYYDGQGHLHRLQVVSARQWNRFWGPPPLSQPDVAAQFQTCLTLDAVWDRILDAVEIPNPPPPAPVVPTLGELRGASSV
jgi:hypothetical protein